MRMIYLVRHGIAADARPGTRDGERALTKEGAERIAATARGWKTLGDPPVAIVTSPLLRARQTGEILHSELDLEGTPHYCDELAAGGSAEELLRFVARVAPAGDVACVGHMPDLVRLLGDLIGVQGTLSADFGKGTVAAIEFVGPLRVGAGVLRALIPNRVLRGLG